MKGNIYKKHDRDTTANDLNPGCRRILANTKARNLKKKLRKKLRKTIDRIVESEEEEQDL